MIVHMIIPKKRHAYSLFGRIFCTKPEDVWPTAYRYWNTDGSATFEEFMERFEDDYVLRRRKLLSRRITAVPSQSVGVPRVIDENADVPDTFSHVFTPETALD